MGGAPEVADRTIESVGEFVTGAGLLGQRHQDRVGKGHDGKDRHPVASYATSCSATACIASVMLVGGAPSRRGYYQKLMNPPPPRRPAAAP
ncbi:hypothetical protein MALGJ_08290 [Mycolicibacter algericus]|uniref:Uncharacterized protein n=1 Tax=Mycolicibacter algericus TaxID=1288388 RepID=A0A7I9Y6P2_MYCAL|nr:hypothetical protein MALGJ_08290 [Mycolicibacter algericus]